MDITYTNEKGRFNYRVGGVTLRNNKVLLVTESRFDFWYLPGGKAVLLEPSNKTIQREITEELGITPIVERVLWTAESMFNFDFGNWSGPVHELAIFYLIKFPDNCALYQTEAGDGYGEIVGNKKYSLKYRWFDLDKLDDVNIQPTMLKKILGKLPTHPTHFINNELNK